MVGRTLKFLGVLVGGRQRWQGAKPFRQTIYQLLKL